MYIFRQMVKVNKFNPSPKAETGTWNEYLKMHPIHVPGNATLLETLPM